MCRAHLRLTLLLAWSLGAISLLVEHRPLEPASRDAGPESLAFEVLRTTKYVSLGPAGFAGITPSSVLAWRVLTEDPQAAGLFQRLLREASPAGQIYAMAGLYLVDPDAFRSGLPILRSHPSPIRWQDGCVVSELAHEGAVAWLQNGTITHRLLAAGYRP